VDGGELPRQVGDIEAVLFVHADDEGLHLWVLAEAGALLGCGRTVAAEQ
jgi:hypothetical protein